MQLTAANVRLFFERMAERFNVTYVPPGLAADLVDVVIRRIPDKYASLLPIDSLLAPKALERFILLDFDPGGDERPLLEQIRVAVDEVTHSVRIRNYASGVVAWYKHYFNPASDTHRATETGLAKLAADEVLWFLGGDQPVPPDLRESHLLTDAGQKFVDNIYKQAADMHGKLGGAGCSSSEVARVAIAILREIG